MQPRPDQITSFGFAYGWSDELQLAAAVLHVDYWGGGSIEFRMPFERVAEFANALAASIRVAVTVADGDESVTDGAVRPYASPSQSSEPEEVNPYPVTGFRFERLPEGVAIVFELHGLDLEAVIVAESQQALHLADYARAWYHRPREAAIAALAGN